MHVKYLILIILVKLMDDVSLINKIELEDNLDDIGEVLFSGDDKEFLFDQNQIIKRNNNL